MRLWILWRSWRVERLNLLSVLFIILCERFAGYLLGVFCCFYFRARFNLHAVCKSFHVFLA